MGLFSLLTRIVIDESTRRRLKEEGKDIRGFQV
jgi:hypothetical protein